MTLRLFLPFLLLFLTFSVLADADVSITAEQGNVPIWAGEDMSLYFVIRNDGPDAASNVILAIDFPPEVTFDRYFGNEETCDTTKRPVLCTIGTLRHREWRSPSIRLRPPVAAGTFPVSVVATHGSSDPRPENNRKTVTFTATPATLMYVAIEGRRRVEPGAVVTTPLTVQSNLRLLDPGNIRVHITTEGTPLELQTPASWSCSITGNDAVCAIPALNPACNCSETATLVQRMPAGRQGGEARISVRVTSDVQNLATESAEAVIQARRILGVTTVADAGPGSLRQAILDANEGCGDLPCAILFEMPPPVPAEGWYTIVPATPLPHITAKRVVLDGMNQTAIADSNPLGPEIAIDGRVAGEGLVLLSTCEAVVQGLAIGNFMDNYGLWFGPDVTRRGTYCGFEWTQFDRVRVSDNYIGVDPTGTAAWPNLRGLRADNAYGVVQNNIISGNRFSGVWFWRGALSFLGNRIGVARDGVTPLPNGASGILVGPQVSQAQILGNTISYHPEMGVALVRGATGTEIRENSMRGNGGLGIDWGMDGRDPVPGPEKPGVPAPMLLSAVYDPAKNETVVTGTIPNAGSHWYTVIDLYANDSPDGDGEQYVQATGGFGVQAAFTARIGRDLRGKWLNATAMRYIPIFGKAPRAEAPVFGQDEQTSELGSSVKVQ